MFKHNSLDFAIHLDISKKHFTADVTNVKPISTEISETVNSCSNKKPPGNRVARSTSSVVKLFQQHDFFTTTVQQTHMLTCWRVNITDSLTRKKLWEGYNIHLIICRISFFVWDFWSVWKRFRKITSFLNFFKRGEWYAKTFIREYNFLWERLKSSSQITSLPSQETGERRSFMQEVSPPERSTWVHHLLIQICARTFPLWPHQQF